ncbi:MAG: hypothetical protein ACR2MS_01165, partial [Weeksellaceae bacterium]
LQYIREVVVTGNFTDDSLQELLVRKNHFLREVEEATSEQIHGIMSKTYGFKNTSLYFTLLLEMKDLVAVAARFVKLYFRIHKEGKLTK